MTMQPTEMTPNLPPRSLNLVSEKSSLSDKDAKKLITWAKENFTQAKNARWKAEKQWYLNLAFYFGRQNVIAQDAPGAARSFRLYTPPAPYYRSRPVVNLIRPLIRTEMSKLTAQKPNAFIVPASSDERDLYAANAGEQLWDSIFREKKIHNKLRRTVFWASITGNGFLKAWWDSEAVDYTQNVKGDLCYESVTPFHIFVPDLQESDIESQPFVLHASNRNIDQLELSYGQKVAQASSEANLLDESFVNVMDVTKAKTEKQKDTLVLEYWIKPGSYKLFPEGGMLSVAGSQILDFFPGWPYEHSMYPFAHLGHVETGKFYRESVIVDLIPLQREYNRTRGQIIESKNRMAKPQLAAEQGSLDPNQITTEPGQVILYRPGFQAPQPIPLQGLPSYVLEEQERIKMDMNEIAGQHEVSRGQVPPGVTAATAISYLQEQDESKLSFTYDSIEELVEKIAKETLCLVKQYWTTSRKVKVAGEDGSFDVMAFEGSDLRDNTDIRAEAGSSLPTSRAAKQAFIMDLMKMGFIDPNKGLEVMEIGGINKIYEQIQIDVRQAQRENLRMAQVTPELLQQHNMEQLQKVMADPQAQQLLATGQLQIDPQTQTLNAIDDSGQLVPLEMPMIVPVNTWDDNRIHIERHNNYRKSQAYERLSQEAKDLFEQHVNRHVAAIMEGAQGAMGYPPGVLDVANNPETYKEMEQGSAPPQTIPEQG